VHVSERTCNDEILRVPFDKLTRAFDSGKYAELDRFVRNSDGLGTPLPPDVCINLGLAVACSNSLLPQYNKDVLRRQKAHIRERRAEQQRLRRKAKNLGLQRPSEQRRYLSSAQHKNSTIHIVTGALIVHEWTKRWHCREQIEILRIMGLHKGDDFIRDRIDYMQTSNARMFRNLELFAGGIRKQQWSAH